MAWGKPTPAVPVTRTGSSGPPYLGITSTSTIFYPHVSSTGDLSLLRMYMRFGGEIDPGALDAVDDVLVESAGVAPADLETHYISYLDSDAAGEFPPIDEAASESVPATWIPSRRWFTRSTLEYIYRYTTPLSTALALPEPHAVDYGNPSVVKVPGDLGGGYLMVLSRSRTFDELATVSEPADGGGGHPVPVSVSTTRIDDIIAYWSQTPDFQDPDATGTAIRGPVLLVDSLAALPDAPFRVFASVPSAAFALDPEDQQGQVALYVYYGVEIPPTPYLAAEAARLYRYHAAVRDSPYGALFEAEKGFIACKRLAWDDVLSALSDPVPEEVWDRNRAVPGELLGRVRVWVAEPYTGFIRYARELLVELDDTVERSTDPEAETCPGASGGTVGDPPDDLVLYLRAAPEFGTDATGSGFWRASAIPHRESLLAEDYEVDARGDRPRRGRITTYGADFVVAPSDSEPGPDRVSPDETVLYDTTTELAHSPSDPDPVRVVSLRTWETSWWVYGGAMAATAYEDKFLGRVQGAATDGCRSWEDAWDF